MSRSDLARELGIGRVTLWRYERDGIIPAPARVNRTQVEYSPEAVAAIRAYVSIAR